MNYLVIPGITEHEEVLPDSFADGSRTASVIINVGTTASRLFEAYAVGNVLAQVSIVRGTGTFILADVLVSRATTDQRAQSMAVEFEAGAVAVHYG